MRVICQEIKRYWIECLVFGVILSVLLCDVANSLTWINTDSDGATYILASKYMWIAHNTSAPLYILLGRLFLYIPLGNDAWRLGLISVLSTLGCSILIYLTVRELLMNNSRGRWYALVSSLIYGGSALVISQSTIIETYALDVMLVVGAYYFITKQKWLLSSIMMGLCLAVHPLLFMLPVAVMVFAFKPMRSKKMLLIMASFLVFYLYIPIVTIVNHPPQMWNNTSVMNFLTQNLGVLTSYTGTLAIWDFPKRILDTIGMLGVSLGVGFIIVIWYFLKHKKEHKELVWLFLLPIIWFTTNLSAETYVYCMPAIAWGAIVTGVGLSKLNMKWLYVTVVVAIGLLGFNAFYFDIGRTLDSNLSATEFYEKELPKIPDGEIFMSGGWNWAIVYLYNKEEGKNIRIVSTDSLVSDEYKPVLAKEGIKYEQNTSEVYFTKQAEMALSIARLNDGVWIAKESNPSTYGYEIVPARGNEAYIARWMYDAPPPIGKWNWKPSNPYDYITGAIEVSEWNHVTLSNYNVRFFVCLASAGLLLNWLIFILPARKKARMIAEKVLK